MLYFKRTPCAHIIEPDPDGIHERHKFKLVKSVPASLTKYTIGTVENLRSALDLTAVAVGRLSNLPVGDLSAIHFPFCKTAADFKSRVGSSCKGFPEEIKRLFGSYEPYGSRNNLLFAINELCNTSKHQIIVPVASRAGVNIPYMESSSVTRPITIFEGIWDGEENEITYAIIVFAECFENKDQCSMASHPR